MTTLTISIPPQPGEDAAKVSRHVAEGASALAEQLRLPLAVDVHVDGDLSDDVMAVVGGVPLQWLPFTTKVASATSLAEAVLLGLTTDRGVLATLTVTTRFIEDAGAADSAVRRWAVRRAVSLGARLDRLAPLLTGIETWRDADTALATALAPTDEIPWRVSVGRELVTEEEAKHRDEVLRSATWRRFGILLPPFISVDSALPPRAAKVDVRDVSYPVIELSSVGKDDESDDLMAFIYYVAANSLQALVTPLSADVALALTTRALPAAARLARGRWPGHSFIEALRHFGSKRPALPPEDLPFVVERLGLVGREIDCGPDEWSMPAGASGALGVPAGCPPVVALELYLNLPVY